jgi:hypothetical protein
VLRIHVDKYSKYSLHPSTFVYVHYVSEATRMTPRKVVTAPEMELWCCAIGRVVTHGPAQASLGPF